MNSLWLSFKAFLMKNLEMILNCSYNKISYIKVVLVASLSVMKLPGRYYSSLFPFYSPLSFFTYSLSSRFLLLPYSSLLPYSPLFFSSLFLSVPSLPHFQLLSLPSIFPIPSPLSPLFALFPPHIMLDLLLSSLF